MRKVVLYAMGGTISMVYDKSAGGLLPIMTGNELVKTVPEINHYCHVETIEFSKAPGSRITPQTLLKLGESIEQTLQRQDVAGVVITHGTDTLEETAYFLDLFISSHKPVCVTGAMRSFGEISPDGALNILCAFRTAIDDEAMGAGVLVVMNEEIHAAARVIKTHSSSTKTFASPYWGALGYVDCDRVIFRSKPVGRQNLHPEVASANVPLVKVYTGMDNSYFDFLLEKGVDGVVIEAFGRGNMSDVHQVAVATFINKGIPVVIATRTCGRPLGLYAYDGGGKKLMELGVIFVDDVTAAKARLKLILALGLTKNINEIRKYFV